MMGPVEAKVVAVLVDRADWVTVRAVQRAARVPARVARYHLERQVALGHAERWTTGEMYDAMEVGDRIVVPAGADGDCPIYRARACWRLAQQ